MKPIIEITRDDEGGLTCLYLRYSQSQVARTITRDPTGSLIVNIDLDADGSPVGLEIVGTNDEEVSCAIEAAREYDLSLAGVFRLTDAQPP
ncbi:MAG: DUF2283 domain-containing protein [Candidatus Eremiobacteraeota bacterium]|nr:DUF2283 domain-containing protein [Candidatus Eremiobacteraeota bacterium]